ncbi:hypothetical protein EV141_0035 [Microcella putealis]|uniref:Uncharacterized protein n=1 Tax=Microcella putealis TaxID=337005 RepID=A0A4Q7LX64_9MICO|nr:hypothetical protein [Microcella putealis]RZS58828.1 hypothetical protein EV141_0035 [Microcella putealis]
MAVGSVVAAGAIGFAAWQLIQPSKLELVHEACAGTNSLRGLGEEANPEQPEEEDSDSLAAVEEAFGKYLEGVVSIEDDGSTLLVQTQSADDDPLGVGTLALDCVNEKLAVPTWVQESISSTRALDGRQTADWDGYSAQWGYHPDNGLNLIILSK